MKIDELRDQVYPFNSIVACPYGTSFPVLAHVPTESAAYDATTRFRCAETNSSKDLQAPLQMMNTSASDTLLKDCLRGILHPRYENPSRTP